MEMDGDFSLSRFIYTYEDTGNIEYRGGYFDTEITLYDVSRLHYTTTSYDTGNVTFLLRC